MIRARILKGRRILFAFTALFLLSANATPLMQTASAGTLTNSYIRLNRMAQAATTSFRLVIKTVGSGATSVAINFNGADSPASSTWTGATPAGAVNTVQATATATCATETGATALPTVSAAGSGSTLTIVTTALSATTSYCVDLTSASAVTNAAAGEYHPTITAGSDSTTVAVRTISNDQIVVSAIVSPTFNLALSGNTDSFPSNLSSGSVGVTSGKTVTINTNAKNGWFAWANDSNTGLTSASASHTIPSITPGTTATLSAGTEGYLFGITSITQGSGGGTTSAAAAYNSNGTTTGSGLDTSIRQIASSNGTANGAVLTVKELAAISATTLPGTDYTDTITIIGAGFF